MNSFVTESLGILICKLLPFKFLSMFKNIVSILALGLTVSGQPTASLLLNDTVNLNQYCVKGLNENEEPKKQLYLPLLGKTFLGFKEDLGFKESSNNYFAVNTLGYLGKYQFGASTLKVIGIHNPSKFLKTPELQEKAFIANVQRNKWVLRRDIRRFVGKKVKGVLITESGILAAAHLAGPGNVKKYLRSYGKVDFADTYGTSMKDYIKRFSGYDTSSIKPKKRVKVKLEA